MKKPILLLIVILYSLLVPFCIIPFFPNYYANIINPIAWLILFILAIIWLDKVYIRNKYQKVITKLSIILIMFYFIIYFLSGMVFGFAASPYAHSIYMIIKNIIAFVLVIGFEEYVRFKLINENKSFKYLFLITILFTFIDLNSLRIPTVPVDIFKFIFSNVFPTLVLNCLCTYLCYIKQFKSSLIIKITPILISLLVPIIPNLDWFYQSIFDILFYFIIYLVIKYEYQKLNKEEKKVIKKSNPIKQIPWLIGTGILIAFVIGVFPYVPLSIISNSMNPVIERGDAVIYSKNYEELKVDDIIVFAVDNKIVVHRIYRITDGTYITKGDNNESIDNWIIEPNQIIGVVKWVVPYIGYPAVELSELLN